MELRSKEPPLGAGVTEFADFFEWFFSFELVVALILAFFLAWLGMRKYVRQKAWLSAYAEKRDLTNQFIDGLNEAGDIVNIIGELHEIQEDPLPQQGLMIHSWSDVRWGPHSKHPYVEQMLSLLPRPDQIEENQSQAAERIAACRNGIITLLIEDYHTTYRRLGNIRARLIQRLRNPDLPTPAVEYVADVFGKLADGSQGRSVDYDSFAETWGRKMAPTKIALRRELTRSILSLRSAIGLSPWWLFRWQIKRLRRKVRSWGKRDAK